MGRKLTFPPAPAINFKEAGVSVLVLNTVVDYWCPKCKSPSHRRYVWAGHGRLGFDHITKQTCDACKTDLEVEYISGTRYDNDD